MEQNSSPASLRFDFSMCMTALDVGVDSPVNIDLGLDCFDLKNQEFDCVMLDEHHPNRD
jgi:hypothetical protein